MLSVLIVNWNTQQPLRDCLRSIEQYPPPCQSETIVVDNASSDGSAKLVRTEFPAVRLIEAGGNVGYAKGNNLAFAASSGELTLTLNPDTEVFPDTFASAIASMESDPKAGVLGARLISRDGSTQRSVRGFPSIVGMLGEATGLGTAFPNSALGSYGLSGFDYELAQYAPQPMGTFLLFRREALAVVGDPTSPFDESFPIFFNEVDLLYRMTMAGWPCRYDPAVRALHLGGASTRQVRKSMIWESHRSLVRFLRKHRRSPAERLLVNLWTPAILASAFVRARGYDPGFRP